MGIYINPKNETKEAWLKREAISISEDDAKLHVEGADDLQLVCLVKNPMFSAALVVIGENDRECVFDPKETRPQLFFLVEESKLEGVSG